MTHEYSGTIHVMDHIFGKVKSTNIKKRRLFVPLILAEILGIAVLIWFLRVPLTEKYLLQTPVSYSLDSMDQDKQYLMRQGDYITGKTIPQSTLQVILYPGSKYAVLTDNEGNFQFQIPEGLKLAEYRLIIINDSVDRLTATKDLKIRIESNNKLDQLLKLPK